MNPKQYYSSNGHYLEEHKKYFSCRQLGNFKLKPTDENQTRSFLA